MNTSALSASKLKRAAQIKSQIERLEARLAKLLGGASSEKSGASSPAPRRKRRKMSAAARAKISAAQRKRWQKQSAKA